MTHTLQTYNHLWDGVYILDFFSYIHKFFPNFTCYPSQLPGNLERALDQETRKVEYFLDDRKLVFAGKAVETLLDVLTLTMWTVTLSPLNSQPAGKSAGFRVKRLRFAFGFTTDWQITLGKSHNLTET